jgi:putative iron-only hydrogenase system regulator
MESNRIALIGIIIENNEISENVNAVLHEYGEFIVGRMGLPYREKSLNVISVVIDAPNNVINGMTGKLGMLDGVSAKALYSNK